MDQNHKKIIDLQDRNLQCNLRIHRIPEGTGPGTWERNLQNEVLELLKELAPGEQWDQQDIVRVHCLEYK